MASIYDGGFSNGAVTPSWAGIQDSTTSNQLAGLSTIVTSKVTGSGTATNGPFLDTTHFIWQQLRPPKPSPPNTIVGQDRAEYQGNPYNWPSYNNTLQALKFAVYLPSTVGGVTNFWNTNWAHDTSQHSSPVLMQPWSRQVLSDLINLRPPGYLGTTGPSITWFGTGGQVTGGTTGQTRLAVANDWKTLLTPGASATLASQQFPQIAGPNTQTGVTFPLVFDTWIEFVLLKQLTSQGLNGYYQCWAQVYGSGVPWVKTLDTPHTYNTISWNTTAATGLAPANGVGADDLHTMGGYAYNLPAEIDFGMGGFHTYSTLAEAQAQFATEQPSTTVVLHGGGTLAAVGTGGALGNTDTWGQQLVARSPNLKAWWRLDDTNTTAIDQVGVSNGTYTGGYTQSILGIPGGDGDNATTLNGTTGFLSVPETANLDLGNGPFSIGVWVKRGVLGTAQGIIDKGTGSYELFFRSDNLIVFGQPTLILSTVAVTDANWHLIGVSFNGGLNTQLYLDGVSVGGKPTSGTLANTSNALRIGQKVAGGGFFSGTVDEVFLIKEAINATSWAALYAAGAAQIGSGTVVLDGGGTLAGTEKKAGLSVQLGFGVGGGTLAVTGDAAGIGTLTLDGGGYIAIVAQGTSSAFVVLNDGGHLTVQDTPGRQAASVLTHGGGTVTVTSFRYPPGVYPNYQYQKVPTLISGQVLNQGLNSE